MSLTVERISEGYKVFPSNGVWGGDGCLVQNVAAQVKGMGYEVNADCYSFTNANEHFSNLQPLETVLAVIFYD